MPLLAQLVVEYVADVSGLNRGVQAAVDAQSTLNASMRCQIRILLVLAKKFPL